MTAREVRAIFGTHLHWLLFKHEECLYVTVLIWGKHPVIQRASSLFASEPAACNARKQPVRT